MSSRRAMWIGALCALACDVWAADPIDLGGRRELFVDAQLVDRLAGARLQLATPRDEGPVLRFDQPWEGPFCGYVTMLAVDGGYRAYYRGLPVAGRDGSANEVTCVAESADGRTWTKPALGLFEAQGSKANNIVLAQAAPSTHNLSPFLDARPDVPADQRFKALGGLATSGLFAWVSADGFRWRKLFDEPVITSALLPGQPQNVFDSQNVAHWSATEGCYVSYFRVYNDNLRQIARTTSTDFRTWTPAEMMTYRHGDGPGPREHLYTNQTAPYFRAPHISVAIAARFMPGRQVLSDEEARALNVIAGYFKDTSDAVLMTTRGGATYDRTFLEGFVRPGIGPQNWVSRTNYPALNLLQTGPAEMSLYVNQDYAQTTSHLRRYSLRLDGLASVRAVYDGGELVTKPLTFRGRRLLLNFATSAAGGVKVELQDAAGQPLPGFALTDAVELIGNEIERSVRWQGGDDVSRLAGQPVRLRFVLKDADLFALRFAE